MSAELVGSGKQIVWASEIRTKSMGDVAAALMSWGDAIEAARESARKQYALDWSDPEQAVAKIIRAFSGPPEAAE